MPGRGQHRPETKILVFNGLTYARSPACDYYLRSEGEQHFYLHREVWEFHHGAIPAGYDIHHVDRNTDHNDVDNLVCLSDEAHGREHHPGEPTAKCCPVCGNEFLCSRQRERGRKTKGLHQDRRNQFCSQVCAQRGRPLAPCLCTQCGQSFLGQHARQRFCSAVCGEAYRYRHRPRGTRLCAGCSVSFTPMHRVSKFCSRECFATHHPRKKPRPPV